MQNYGMNGYYNPYNQQRFTPLKIYSVSNIMEANATPVENLDPVFFFNRSENVIYKKQIDGTGAAPIQIYKLAEPQHEISNENTSANINTYEENFKALNDKIDGLYKFFEEEEITEDKKGGKK
jgi:soluble cytochrome b562